MTVFISVLMIQVGRDGKLNGDIQKEPVSQEGQNMKGETEETEPECDFEGYQALDVNLFGSEFLSQVIVDRAAKYTGEGNEEFVPVVCENSSFPERLIVKMEEVLHQVHEGKGVSGALYTEFGLQDFRLTERIGDEFRTIYEFDIPFTLTTGVIQYEGKFYFITVDEDINVKAEYGVTIYSLDYDSPGNSISIHYQPEKYAAESYGTDSGKLTPLIESGYMDKVLEDFSSGKYLHEGNQKDGAEIYYGDEERAFEEELEGSANEIYKMDITNRGYPVYLCKDIYLPWEDDVRRQNKQLGVDFFYFDTENMYFQKLEELSIPKKYCEAGYLTQMWFKKWEEKYMYSVYIIWHVIIT